MRPAPRSCSAPTPSSPAMRAAPIRTISMRCAMSSPAPSRCARKRASAWAERFGKRILEGYGVTECSPVIAVNTPMHYSAGTVGRVSAIGSSIRLEPVAGIGHGGRLFVRGPNVMPAICGPSGEVDGAAARDGTTPATSSRSTMTGFVAIVGRAKRFAKLGGEMVSLAAVERIAETARPKRATRSSPCRTRAAARGWCS